MLFSILVNAQLSYYEGLNKLAKNKDLQYEVYYVSGSSGNFYLEKAKDPNKVYTLELSKFIGPMPFRVKLKPIGVGGYGIEISESKEYYVDHTIIPSFLQYSKTYLVIDGVIIVFDKGNFNKDDATFTKPHRIYIPKGAVTEKAKSIKKKKLSLKERLKAAKSKMGAGLSSNLSSKAKAFMKSGIKQQIEDYLASMKKRQKAYTLTADDKKLNIQRRKSYGDLDAYLKKSNEDFEKSEAGQRYRKSVSEKSTSTTSSCTVTNNSSYEFFIQEGSINAVHINKGSSYSYFDAGKTIYYSDNNRKKHGVAVSKCVAGQTYKVK